MKYALLVGYSGAEFAGSQYQPDKRTVEGEFIKAGISCGLWDSAEEAHFRTAGRTDKGVSARRQLITVTFDNIERFREAVNFHLPPDIWCLGYAPVPDEFYARFAAKSRTYRYYFPYPLNLDAMQKVADVFVGTKDYSGFAKLEPGRDPVRTVLSATVLGINGLPVFEVDAKSFLWNMVRGMAGFLFAAGMGLVGPEDAEKQFASHEWRVHPAPAEGLVLWDFDADISFEPVKQRYKSDRDLFSQALHARQSALVSEVLIRTDRGKLLKNSVSRNYGSLSGSLRDSSRQNP